jgi:hypothetical protein
MATASLSGISAFVVLTHTNAIYSPLASTASCSSYGKRVFGPTTQKFKGDTKLKYVFASATARRDVLRRAFNDGTRHRRALHGAWRNFSRARK